MSKTIKTKVYRTTIFAIDKEKRTQESFEVMGKTTAAEAKALAKEKELAYAIHYTEAHEAFIPVEVANQYVGASVPLEAEESQEIDNAE